MAIPHKGHGRNIKYGGNNAANSREIDMMPRNYKIMGDVNKDIAPTKIVSGSGSKEGVAKMMDQKYGGPTMHYHKKK
tara:strand:- start:1832 stop:2062 length:231 start_codon:yes stop_codon:yes gene_type:complete